MFTSVLNTLVNREWGYPLQASAQRCCPFPRTFNNVPVPISSFAYKFSPRVSAQLDNFRLHLALIFFADKACIKMRSLLLITRRLRHVYPVEETYRVSYGGYFGPGNDRGPRDFRLRCVTTASFPGQFHRYSGFGPECIDTTSSK